MKLKKILPVLILALLLVYFFFPGETGETPQTAPVQNVQTAPEPAKEDGGDLALLPAGEADAPEAMKTPARRIRMNRNGIILFFPCLMAVSPFCMCLEYQYYFTRCTGSDASHSEGLNRRIWMSTGSSHQTNVRTGFFRLSPAKRKTPPGWKEVYHTQIIPLRLQQLYSPAWPDGTFSGWRHSYE